MEFIVRDKTTMRMDRSDACASHCHEVVYPVLVVSRVEHIVVVECAVVI